MPPNEGGPRPDVETELRAAVATYRAAIAAGKVHPPSPPSIDLHPLAIAARRAWWRAGAPGHYPSCPCGACTPRGPTP